MNNLKEVFHGIKASKRKIMIYSLNTLKEVLLWSKGICEEGDDILETTLKYQQTL